MTEKKQSKNWYVAFIHFLIGGFIVPALVGVVGGLIISPIFVVLSLSNSSVTVMTIILSAIILAPIGTWYGAKYSAGYLNKSFIIADKNSIVNLSTVYLAVLPSLYKIYQITSGQLAGTQIIVSFIGLIITIIIFYVFSKKYINQS